MTNRENLRDRYEKYWPLTAKREEHIKNMLEKALKVKVEPYGLGAMSTERIKGSAKENGCDTADPDLYVTEYDFFVESRVRFRITYTRKMPFSLIHAR